MKKIISFLYLLFIVKLAAFSQQDPQFTNYMEYKLGFNPGFAGTDGTISGLILNRYQWEGFKGAPRTLVFSANASVTAFGSPGGVGINVVDDQIGFAKNTQINVNYSYIKALSIGNLGIGLSLGLFNQSINGEWEVPEDNLGIYTQPESDPLIPQGDVSQMTFDMGFGLYLKSNKYYLGASVTHINQASIKYDKIEYYFLVRHYYLMGGYNIKLSDPLFVVRPSFLFKSDLAGWQMDLNTNIIFDERFWGGITYRFRDAIALLLGMEMENGLRFGYSFDLVTSAIGRDGFGSHEIYVSYSLDLERNRTQKYKSIRFL
jgi:type IX secretion system PorP/SprF family membrane protein